MSQLMMIPNSILATSREVQRNDGTWLVVPGVPLREMVVNRYLAPGEEIAHVIKAWNGIPVTIRHPQQNGGAANVPDPDVPIIGRLYNADWDAANNRLLGEYWINLELADQHEDGKAIVEKIRDGKQIETSTGYYADIEDKSGTFGGESYVGIQRNMRPEHLAILPDQIGACSLKDGCGVNRNCRETTVNCNGCPCGGKAAGANNDATPNQSNEGERIAGDELPTLSNTIHNQIEETMKRNFVMSLLERLGVTVNDASAIQVEEDPAPGGDPAPASPAPAAPTPAAAPTATEQNATASLTQNELADIRGWINLSTEFGGPEGFKKLLTAMQEVSAMQQNAAQTNERATRDALTATLTKNARCPFSRDELDAMPVEHLTKLAKALVPVNYAGLGYETVTANDSDNAPASVLLRQPAQAGQ